MKINKTQFLVIAVFILTINLIFSDELKIVEVGKPDNVSVAVGNYTTTEQSISVSTSSAININNQTSESAISSEAALEVTTKEAIEVKEEVKKYSLDDYNVVDGTKQTGQATYYSKKFNGRKTTNGEKFSIYKFTGAHRTLKFGTLVKVTNVDNGKSVIVRINDRGPFTKGKIIDLSPAAFTELAKLSKGILKVSIEVLEKKENSKTQNTETNDVETKKTNEIKESNEDKK